MCGRFSSINAIEELARMYLAIVQGNSVFTGSYNICPTELAPIVYEHSDARKIEAARFGFTMNIKGKSFPLMNIQSEKASNREDFKTKRCLIPANGFYEWEKANPKDKQPYYYSPKDNNVFHFAGVWRQEDKGPAFSILTTTANSLVGEIHARMPVILSHNAAGVWLAPDSTKESLKELLEPYSPGLMQVWKVSKDVNSPKNKQASCINSL